VLSLTFLFSKSQFNITPNPKFHFRVDKITPLVPIWNHTIPVLNEIFHFFKNGFSIAPSFYAYVSQAVSFLWISSPKSCRHFSHPSMNNSCLNHLTKGIIHFPAVFEIMPTLDTEASDSANYTYT
jgi:hypothetical protein